MNVKKLKKARDKRGIKVDEYDDEIKIPGLETETKESAWVGQTRIPFTRETLPFFSSYETELKSFRPTLKFNLQIYDGHHMEAAVYSIVKNNLHERPVVRNLMELPIPCRSCRNCIRAVSYCSVYGIGVSIVTSCLSRIPLENYY